MKRAAKEANFNACRFKEDLGLDYDEPWPEARCFLFELVLVCEESVQSVRSFLRLKSIEDRRLFQSLRRLRQEISPAHQGRMTKADDCCGVKAFGLERPSCRYLSVQSVSQALLASEPQRG